MATTDITPELRDFVTKHRLTTPDWKHTAWRFALHIIPVPLFAVAAYTFSGTVGVAAAAAGIVWLCATMCVAGSIVHEAIHYNLFKNRVANDAAGVLWGLLVLNPYVAYRTYHLHHHSHKHAPGDTEGSIVLDRTWQWAFSPFTLLGLSVVLWGDMFKMMFAPGSASTPKFKSRVLLYTNAAALAATVAGVTWWAVSDWRTWLLWWLLPFVVGNLLNGAAAAAEHYGTGWGPDSVYRTTRSTESNTLMRALLWNVNYHVAHHLLPQVTGKNLPVLHEQIRERHHYLEKSYMKWHLTQIQALRSGMVAERAPWDIAASNDEV